MKAAISLSREGIDPISISEAKRYLESLEDAGILDKICENTDKDLLLKYSIFGKSHKGKFPFAGENRHRIKILKELISINYKSKDYNPKIELTNKGMKINPDGRAVISKAVYYFTSYLGTN